MRIAAIRSLAIVLPITCLALPAQAERVQLVFDVEVSGMKAMKMAFDGDIAKTSYSGSVSLKPRGLAKWFIKKKFSLQVRGRVQGERLLPEEFTMVIEKKKKRRAATVRWSGGKPSWQRTPPHDTATRKAIAAALTPGVLDPLSLLIRYVRAGRDDFCSGRVQVFDGHDLYGIIARKVGRTQVRGPQYTGPVIICRLTYVPGPGSMSKKKKRRWRRNPPVFDVWLGKVKSAQSGHLFVPVRVSGNYDGRAFIATPAKARIAGRPLQPAP